MKQGMRRHCNTQLRARYSQVSMPDTLVVKQLKRHLCVGKLLICFCTDSFSLTNVRHNTCAKPDCRPPREKGNRRAGRSWNAGKTNRGVGCGAYLPLGGPKNRGSFPAIVPLNNPWELRAFGVTHQAPPPLRARLR